MATSSRALCACLVLACALTLGAAGELWNFNFQPLHTDHCALGALIDSGQKYNTRPSGLKYGWINRDTDEPFNATLNARYRDVADLSCIQRTLMHMQYSDCCADDPSHGVLAEVAWDIEVTPGTYKITVTCGDPEGGDDSSHSIRANGEVVMTPWTPTTPGELMNATRVINVSDTHIRITPEGGHNTKIVSLSIERLEGVDALVQMGCSPFPSLFNGLPISSLGCDKVMVNPPFELLSTSSQAGLPDQNNRSTGMTMYLTGSNQEEAYDAAKIFVAQSALQVTTSGGQLQPQSNDATNVLGVGLPLPDNDIAVELRVLLPQLKRKSEEACLVFFASEVDFAEICLSSFASGEQFTVRAVGSNQTIQRYGVPTQLGGDNEVLLRAELYPLNNTVRLMGSTDKSKPTEYGWFEVDPDMFSKDAAGIDFHLGTRSFVGFQFIQGERDEPITFSVRGFNADVMPRAKIDLDDLDVDFDTWFLDAISFPTNMAYGPDGMLYVTGADGTITKLELDHAARKELSRSQYQPVGASLVLGITFDPDSDASSPVMYISHSDVSQRAAQANSGKVTRVAGSTLSDVKDVVVGLPRAYSNHAPNSIKFGPDGRLYLTIGSNSAGGVPNDQPSDFGFRGEQCFSASMVVMDVKADGFNGDCTPSQSADELDRTGVAAPQDCNAVCDVKLYATGMRNSYDYVFHTNGHLYATDNGLGGKGTAPDLPSGWQQGDECSAPVLGDAIHSHDPGIRNDLLHDVVEGSFHGHPNPQRSQCVYFAGGQTTLIPSIPLDDGTTYDMSAKNVYPDGQAPDPDFQPAMLSLGESHSANGIIMYDSDAFCGAMRGHLLTTFYSQEDQVHRLKLSDDGKTVESDSTLPRTSYDSGATDLLRDPLCIAQRPESGSILVGEFLGGRVRVLEPLDTGKC